MDNLIGGKLDLIIDDGLHAPNANLATLNYALRKLSRNGFVVIEDILPCHMPVWNVINTLLTNYTRTFVQCPHTYMLVLQNNGSV